jgi:hypothetical protein
MQDDQNGPHIVVLALADMARLPPSIIIQKISPSAGTTPTLNLPCFTHKWSRPFLKIQISFMFLDFYAGHK